MVVEATDADEGENGRITYLLNRQSAEVCTFVLSVIKEDPY